MREHQPITIDKFNGLWSRGNIEETPMDHFSDCNNIQYIGSNTFTVRDGIGRSQSVASPISNILRIYNYATDTGNTLLVLTSGGNIYHVVDSTTIFGPILTIAAMTDFAFASYGGRAYISPFTTELINGLNYERGLQNDFLYVYKGDGTSARKAGGTTPTSVLTAANGNPGNTDAGVHIFGYVYETDTGYLTPPGGLVAFTTDANFSVDFTGVANSPDAFVVKKHIVASKVIQDYNGDLNGYTLYFIPDATIPNNVTTTLNDISFFDAALLDDASHLSDNFAEIPAGAALFMYHNRLCLATTFDNVSTVYVSSPGEPEAFNQVDGVLDIPKDGNYVTNGAELRDVLYVTKRAKVVSFVDNGDIPSTWPLTVVDNSMGCGVHGIASVLDTSASGVDYLIISSYKGIMLFNGKFILPELTWKIQTFWAAQDFLTKNRIIQMVNDPVTQRIYCVLTDNSVLYGDYSNGFDPKSIRWSPWTFDVKVNALALINVSELILACDQAT
jgi:hypothetical protein